MADLWRRARLTREITQQIRDFFDDKAALGKFCDLSPSRVNECYRNLSPSELSCESISNDVLFTDHFVEGQKT
jgi:hypothetical protein